MVLTCISGAVQRKPSIHLSKQEAEDSLGGSEFASLGQRGRDGQAVQWHWLNNTGEVCLKLPILRRQGLHCNSIRCLIRFFNRVESISSRHAKPNPPTKDAFFIEGEKEGGSRSKRRYGFRRVTEGKLWNGKTGVSSLNHTVFLFLEAVATGSHSICLGVWSQQHFPEHVSVKNSISPPTADNNDITFCCELEGLLHLCHFLPHLPSLSPEQRVDQAICVTVWSPCSSPLVKCTTPGPPRTGKPACHLAGQIPQPGITGSQPDSPSK
ncbi:hypothetical protein SRHO_G00269980 [Serrasalmus rhombeus]